MPKRHRTDHPGRVLRRPPVCFGSDCGLQYGTLRRMDGVDKAPEDLSVNLHWPGDDEEAISRPRRRDPDVTDESARATETDKMAPSDVPSPNPAASVVDEARGLRRRSPTASPPASPRAPEDPSPPPTSPPALTPGTGQAISGPPTTTLAVQAVSPDLAERLDDLAVVISATTSRMDTLTDAVATHRGYVTEGMRDLSDALTRSKNQITSDLERTLSRVQAQIAKQIDEAIVEARTQTTRDLDEGAAKTQEQTARHLAAVLDRLESQAARRTASDERRQEQIAATMKTAMTTGEESARRFDKVASGISTELATIGQRLSNQVDMTNVARLTDVAAVGDQLGALIEEVTQATRAEVNTANRRLTNDLTATVTASGRDWRAHAKGVAADISLLGDSVADALAQVADRLELLASKASGQQDVIEAVTQALDDVATRVDDVDSSNRSRHDRILAAIGDLQSKRNLPPAVDLEPVTKRLDRLGTLVVALVDASEETPISADAFTQMTERLEGVEATITDQVGSATADAVRSLTEAAERAANRIQNAVPPSTERSTLAAITRVEGRLSELTRRREEHERTAKEVFDNIAETVSRLASAQAEDLERILDSVESIPEPAAPPTVSLAASDAQRLAGIEDELRRLGRTQPATGGDVDGAVLEQMATLGAQIDALRRRMAVRARSQGPVLDTEALDAIADAVAARLAPAGSRQPRATPPDRSADTVKPAIRRPRSQS